MPELLTAEQVGLPLNTFTGKVVIITGAGRGIGLECARAFARLGAQVVIAELDSATGAQAAQQITGEGGHAVFIPTDVSDAASVAALIQQVGAVDILINNAIVCPVELVQEMSVELFDRVISVNLRGAFLTCRAVLPGMLQRQRGTIINMVSTEAMPGLSAYIATKQGIVGFTQSLAAEVSAAGLKVIAFGPGMVDTPSIRSVAPRLAPLLGMTEEQFRGLSLHPAYGGLMPAEDSAAATVYLAARMAEESHGEVINAYEVLERAGYLHKTELPSVAAAFSSPVSEMQTSASVLDALQKLEEMLRQTDEEFNKLPVFVRPMARGGFKSKSGQSAADWLRATARLRTALEGNQAAEAELETQRLLPFLEKLITYYRGVPAETARFTKDQPFLVELARQMAEREENIHALGEALKNR